MTDIQDVLNEVIALCIDDGQIRLAQKIRDLKEQYSMTPLAGPNDEWTEAHDEALEEAAQKVESLFPSFSREGANTPDTIAQAIRALKRGGEKIKEGQAR